MSETSEVEALAKVMFEENEAARLEMYRDPVPAKKYEDIHEDWKVLARRVAAKVAKAVRAQDAARSGPLTGTQVTLALADVSSRIGPMQAVVLHEHMTAQGRTIAKLTQETLEWRLATACQTPTDAKREREEAFRAAQQRLEDEEKERDEARDELAKARARDAERTTTVGLACLGDAANTMFRTLEQAADYMKRLSQERDEARAELVKAQERIAELEAKADRSENRRGWARSEALAANAAANTATTDMQSAWTRTAIAEQRTKRAESALATLRRAVWQCVSALDGLLGDSDSSEDDRPGVKAMQAAMAALNATPAEHPDTATRGDSGQGGGVDKPTTPPDVAAMDFSTVRAACRAADDEAAKHTSDMAASEVVRFELNPNRPEGEQLRVMAASEPKNGLDGVPDWKLNGESDPYASEPTPEEDWECVRRAVTMTRLPSHSEEIALAALARLKAEPSRAADSHGVSRPVLNCVHVNAADGLCTHPNNMTPECHKDACPLLPEKVARRAAEDMRDRCVEAAQQAADGWLEAAERNEKVGVHEAAERNRMRAQVAADVRQAIRSLPL